MTDDKCSLLVVDDEPYILATLASLLSDDYEVLTRDAALLNEEDVRFDLVVLDEAQRIKNKDSKTAQAARSLRRERERDERSVLEVLVAAVALGMDQELDGRVRNLFLRQRAGQRV